MARNLSLQFTDGCLFNGSQGVRPEASIGDMFAAMFEAPNRAGEHSPRADFLRDVLLSAADDLEMVSAVQTDNSDLLQRFALRAEWRIKMAVELVDRIDEAAGANDEPTGGAS